MKIIAAQKNDTVAYAASELKKYITELSRGSIVPEICPVDELPVLSVGMWTEKENSIVLGLLEELALDTSDLTEPFIDDIIDVNVTNCNGYIAGSNPRSILMGVYKYCTSAGCRFLRPGADGDYVPFTDLKKYF